jgi:hypothetical protein
MLIKTTLSALLLSMAALPAFSDEYEGTMRTYKPAEHSSNVHTRFRGSAAQAFFNHMSQAREFSDPTQKIVVRKSADMDCTNYYGEETPYYECLFTMNEAGVVRGGYDGG